MRLTEKQQAAMIKLLTACASKDEAVAAKARQLFAEALRVPLREGVFAGSFIFDIYEEIPVDTADSTPSFPLHFVKPGTECNFSAFTIARCGAIPYNEVSGDEFKVPLYPIANSIDTCLSYIKKSRWDVVKAMADALMGGYVDKMHSDGMHVILSAAASRKIIVADKNAAQGHLTTRVISLMSTVMERNGGGNAQSTRRGTLTDVIVSPEAMGDIRNWNTDQISDATRHMIHMNDGVLSGLYGTNIRSMSEFGVGQPFQDYLVNTAGVTLPTTGSHTDVEFFLGLDLSKDDGFLMPVDRDGIQVFEDKALHRSQRWGLYSTYELGFGAPDSRRVILGSM